eukprot:690975-Rhodomonas_salina.1
MPKVEKARRGVSIVSSTCALSHVPGFGANTNFSEASLRRAPSQSLEESDFPSRRPVAVTF